MVCMEPICAWPIDYINQIENSTIQLMNFKLIEISHKIMLSVYCNNCTVQVHVRAACSNENAMHCVSVA